MGATAQLDQMVTPVVTAFHFKEACHAPCPEALCRSRLLNICAAHPIDRKLVRSPCMGRAERSTGVDSPELHHRRNKLTSTVFPLAA